MDSLDSMFAPPAPYFAPPPPPPSFSSSWLIIALLFIVCLFLFFRKGEAKEEREKPERKEPPKEERKETERPKEEKKGVREAGIAVRDALLNFSVEAEQIAAIVRYTVSILSPNTRPALKAPSAPPPVPIPTPNPTPHPTPQPKTHFSVKGLELPEEEVTAEPAGEKQGKINADTNPRVLQMVKDRKA